MGFTDALEFFCNFRTRCKKQSYVKTFLGMSVPKTMTIQLENQFSKTISWFFEESPANVDLASVIDLGSSSNVGDAHNYRFDVPGGETKQYTAVQGNNYQGEDRGYAMWVGFECNDGLPSGDATCTTDQYHQPSEGTFSGKCFPNEKFNPPNGCKYGGLKGAQGHIVEYNVGLPGASMWFDLSAVDGAANYVISVDAQCTKTTGEQACCEGTKGSGADDECSKDKCKLHCAFPMDKCPAKSKIGKTLEFDGATLSYCMSPMQTCNCDLSAARDVELGENRPCGVGATDTCGGVCSLDGILEPSFSQTEKTSQKWIKLVIAVCSTVLLSVLVYSNLSGRISLSLALVTGLAIAIACAVSFILIPSSKTQVTSEVPRTDFKMDDACGCTGCNSALKPDHAKCHQNRKDKFCQSSSVSSSPDGWEMPVVQKTKYAQAIDGDCTRTYAYPYGDVGKLGVCRYNDLNWTLKVTVGPPPS